MTIVRRDVPSDLFRIVSEIKQGTTLLEISAVFVISVLVRNQGNRTKTARDLKMPVRSLRHRLWHIESLGYAVPEPRNTKGGFNAFKKFKTNKTLVKKTKKYDL